MFAPHNVITKDYIDSLINDNTPEGQHIEYKEKIHDSRNPKDKGEFLKDVSAFANASGGCIIFGIKENAGNDTTPGNYQIVGLTDCDIDEISRTFHHVLDSHIEPKIPTLKIIPIEDHPAGVILVIWIPKSWIGPHRVTYEGSNKGYYNTFYSRRGSHNVALDIQEIRSDFATSLGKAQSYQNFRDQRLTDIIAGNSPVPLLDGGKIILHILPLRFFDPSNDISISTGLIDQVQTISNVISNYHAPVVNFDGLLACDFGNNEGGHIEYLQLFRNGAIEIVNSYIISHSLPSNIDGPFFDSRFIKFLKMALSIEKELNIDPPFIVLVSLTGVKGKHFARYSVSTGHRMLPISKDILVFPDRTIDSYGEDPKSDFLPLLDMVWQSSGWTKTPSFNHARNTWTIEL